MTEPSNGGIRVDVRTEFLKEQSEQSGQKIFAYTVTINNDGPAPAKLLARHWVITDAWGRIQEVKGDGVIGMQPRLEPGQHFEYTSFCPLPTKHGEMHGWYRMARDDGETFEAKIDPFHMVEPDSLN